MSENKKEKKNEDISLEKEAEKESLESAENETAKKETKKDDKKDAKKPAIKFDDKKKKIIAAVAGVAVVGVVAAVVISNGNAKVPGKKNDSLLSAEPERISISVPDEKSTAADVTAIKEGKDKNGKVVDTKGITDLSGHKVYDTGERDNKGNPIYTTGKKASNGRVIYTKNVADSFGSQIYYTGYYNDKGELKLTNTIEKPDYTTNETPKKYVPTTTTTTKTIGYDSTSNIVIKNAENTYFRYFGGSGIDSFRSVAPCEDGGYVLTCFTQSYNGDLEGSNKDWGIHTAIVKYDADGKQLWKYILGGDNIVSFEGVAELKDGSIVAVGSTSLSDVENASATSKSTSTIVVRLDKKGGLMWTYVFPGDKEQAGDSANCIAATPDGGFVVGGTAKSKTGFFKGDAVSKAYLFKFDKNGNIKWRRTLNGSKSDVFKAVSVADNGEIYAVCVTTSQDGDFAGLIKGKDMTKNSMLIKLDKNGDLKWSKNLDGSGNSEFNSVSATSDGGCIIAGSYSIATRADGIYTSTYGKSDGYVIRYNDKGEVCWARNYGGAQNDYLFGVTEIKGGFAIAGNTQSVDYNLQGYGNNGGQDAFIMYLNEKGEISFVDMLGGSQAENILSICTLTDGSVIGAGTTKSTDDVFKGSGASGQFKAFLIKSAAVTEDGSKKK